MPKVQQYGAHAGEKLLALQKEFPDLLKEVRPVGLAIGLSVASPDIRDELYEQMRRRGLLLNTTAHPTNLRFYPPLDGPLYAIDEAVEIMRSSLRIIQLQQRISAAVRRDSRAHGAEARTAEQPLPETGLTAFIADLVRGLGSIKRASTDSEMWKSVEIANRALKYELTPAEALRAHRFLLGTHSFMESPQSNRLLFNSYANTLEEYTANLEKLETVLRRWAARDATRKSSQTKRAA